MAAFVPEEIADDDVDEGRGNERRDGENLEGVGGGPESEKRGGADGGLEPEFMVRVKLRAEEKTDGREAEQGVIQGTEHDVGADPGRKSGAQIMESVESPADGPIEKIVLALERINIGEEHSDEECSEKQAERDHTLRHLSLVGSFRRAQGINKRLEEGVGGH